MSRSPDQLLAEALDLPREDRAHLAESLIASVNTIAALSTRELWYFTGGFALLALLTSPVARAATEPLSEEIVERIARWRGRFRLGSGSQLK